MVAHARAAVLCCIAAIALAAPARAAPPLLALRSDAAPAKLTLEAAAARAPLVLLPRIRLARALEFGDGERGLRLDGVLTVDGDYPVLDGRLRVRAGGRELVVTLPSLQAVPRMFYGTLAVEVRVRLIAWRF